MRWQMDSEHEVREIRRSYGKTLEELINANFPVMVCDADLSSSSGAGFLFEKYPQNTVNFGICEANMIAAAAAMSRTGLKPFVHSFAPFVSRRVMDQVYISAAFSKQDLHIYGSDPGYWSLYNGATHTTFEDIAIMRSIPNVTVVAPSDDVSFSWILKWYAQKGGVIYNRCSRKPVPSIYKKGSEFEFGKSQLLRRGNDVALIAIGASVYDALESSKILEEKGISTSVIDLFFVKPLDENLIKEVIESHKLIVTIENHSIYGGIGDLIGSVMAEYGGKAILKKIGINDRFCEVGTREYLKKIFGLNINNIVEKVEEAMKTIKE